MAKLTVVMQQATLSRGLAFCCLHPAAWPQWFNALPIRPYALYAAPSAVTQNMAAACSDADTTSVWTDHLS